MFTIYSIGIAIQALALAAATYLLTVSLYRLLFHPLSKYPGPRLAAITDVYAAWYDVIERGALVDHLEILHGTYGPVIRIGPNKLHFSSPNAYDDIYRNVRFTKYPPFYDAVHEKQGSFGFIDQRLSKARRDLLGPFFSRKAVLKLEDVIQATVDELVCVLSKRAGTGEFVNLRYALMSVSFEIITTYCFAKTHNSLTYPDFAHPIIRNLESVGVYVLFSAISYFPWLERFVFDVPAWLTELLGVGSAGSMQALFRDIGEQVDEVLDDPSVLERAEHETIYTRLLSPESRKSSSGTPSRQSLMDEAAVMVAAGTETVGNACTTGIFHILRNSEVEQRLRLELSEAWPDASQRMSLEGLEKLPYLTAIIKESLRLSHGLSIPLPRVTPGPVTIAGCDVPAGTVVSSGHTFVHLNPDLYPEPHRFNPERWMNDSSPDMRYLVSFSKGPRMCLGVNLAWAELYLILGTLFRKLKFGLPKERPAELRFHSLLTVLYEGHPLQVYIDQ